MAVNKISLCHFLWWKQITDHIQVKRLGSIYTIGSSICCTCSKPVSINFQLRTLRRNKTVFFPEILIWAVFSAMRSVKNKTNKQKKKHISACVKLTCMKVPIICYVWAFTTHKSNLCHSLRRTILEHWKHRYDYWFTCDIHRQTNKKRLYS